MNHRTPVRIIGTPRGTWQALADALIHRLPPSDGHSIVVGDPASDELVSASGDDACNYLVFLEVPDLTTVSASEIGSAINEWLVAARRVRQHLQRYPKQCVAVEVEESYIAFDDLVSMLLRRFDLQLMDVESPWLEAGVIGRTALRRLISSAVVVAHPLANALMEELRQSCVSLSQIPVMEFEAKSAMSGLHSLEAEAVEAKRAAAEHVRAVGTWQANAAAAASELAQFRGSQATTTRGFAELRAENELLLLQLQQQHNDRALRAPPEKGGRDAAVGGVEPVEIDKIVLGGARSEPPHREIGLTMLGLRIGNQRIGELGLRLVEHNGHPGIVIFASAVRPLAGWSETGIDFGQSFMLLVPADPSSRLRLQSFSTSDWRRLQSLTNAIEEGVIAAVAEPRWLLIAKRLAQELAELPQELRFDNISAVCKPDKDVWELTLQGLDLDGRWLERLNLQWTPVRQGGKVHGGELQVLKATSLGAAGLPFATWPLSDEGKPAQAVTLSLGAGVAVETRRREWSLLSTTDRTFVFGLLRTLDRLASQSTPVGQTGEALREAFGETLHSVAADIDRALRVTPWRRMARRIKRTFRFTPAQTL